MQATAIERAKSSAKPYSRLIDLGNGVMFPVNSEKEARAGRASLPTAAPGTFAIPPRDVNTPVMSTEEFEAFYEEMRADRF